MSRSSACSHDRGQVHPFPALVAVLVLTLSLTAYADVVQPLPEPDTPAPAVPALKRIEAAATTGAILDPAALDADAAELGGYDVNVALITPTRRYSDGPTPPTAAARADASVAADVDNRTEAARLIVRVWT